MASQVKRDGEAELDEKDNADIPATTMAHRPS